MARIPRTLLVLTLLALASAPQGGLADDCDRGAYDGAYGGEQLLPQNWTCADRQAFWFVDQGSQIVPYVWFLHLEQADSNDKFVAAEHIDRFRYLPQTPTAVNADGLPIGFTRGNARGNPAFGAISDAWLGMTCAACHTGQVDYGGTSYLIDGAPALGDFETLFVELVRAMRATLDDPSKFERFAEAVIADSAARRITGTSDRDELRRQLERVADMRETWNRRNRGTSDYGHGRLDAIGAIFNEVAATGLGVPENAVPANAPVSYPFLWDTPQHDQVQWNGSIVNRGLGALVRNVGEVLGVFGALDLNTVRLSRTGHANSIDMAGLGALESLLIRLQSPRWQDTRLPAIDPVLADKGRAEYERFCSGCHRPIDRADPKREVKAVMMPITNPKDAGDPNALGTDPATAVNFLTRTANAERLSGLFVRYWGHLSAFQQFPMAGAEATPTASVLGYAVFGVITRALYDDPEATLAAMEVGQPPEVVAAIEQASAPIFAEPGKPGIRKFLKALATGLNAPTPEPGRPACFPKGELPCYKARPLNGIWATAPYLHNGSVRTLRQLLLPAGQRERVFKVGSRRFDAAAIGFVDEGASTLDTSLPGNANRGHDGPIYGNAVFAENPDRLEAILEYLKTL